MRIEMSKEFKDAKVEIDDLRRKPRTIRKLSRMSDRITAALVSRNKEWNIVVPADKAQAFWNILKRHAERLEQASTTKWVVGWDDGTMTLCTSSDTTIIVNGVSDEHSLNGNRSEHTHSRLGDSDSTVV